MTMDQAVAFVASLKYHTFPGTTMTACCATCLNGQFIVACFNSGPDADQEVRERNAYRACLLEVFSYMVALKAI